MKTTPNVILNQEESFQENRILEWDYWEKGLKQEKETQSENRTRCSVVVSQSTESGISWSGQKL